MSFILDSLTLLGEKTKNCTKELLSLRYGLDQICHVGNN